MPCRRALPVLATTGVAALALAACSAGPGSATADDAGVTVLAAVYPLEYVAEQVGGQHVTVDALTPPGAEPHDLELSPRQVRSVGEADVVLVVGGFQAAVDEAVEARAPEHLVDAAATPAVAEHAAEHADADGEEPTTGDDGEEDDGHDHAGADPHFWQDPTLLAAVAQDVADALAAADAEHADVYAANAERLASDLGALDEEIATGLATCEQRVVVTAHEAFGFLAERYDLEQVGISGLDPEAEPSPARLRDIRSTVEASGVTTIFTEVLVSPKVAETLADDLGITTRVLDPLESRPEDGDYRGAMERNLEALREALACA